MTVDEKRKIEQLRQRGYGYRKIAQELGLSANTVKSYCYRNPPTKAARADFVCKQCGKPIEQIPARREKKFCSDTCRMKWWTLHRDEIQHRKSLVCKHCGKTFYGKPHRKFCSHTCYIAERFGGRHDV